jgi:DNA-binding transcriptional ArsR family regulator
MLAVPGGSASVPEIRPPATGEPDLGAVFAALADPLRRAVIQRLLGDAAGTARQCSTFAVEVSRSTMTHHFRVLREAGLIRQVDYGNRCEVALRRAEIEERFPGLLALLEAEAVRAPAAARTTTAGAPAAARTTTAGAPAGRAGAGGPATRRP